MPRVLFAAAAPSLITACGRAISLDANERATHDVETRLKFDRSLRRDVDDLYTSDSGARKGNYQSPSP
jgi:hypothetical protein